MMLRAVFAIVLGLAVAPAEASERTAAWCLAPLPGGQPVSEVEQAQPYRLASEIVTIPGYPLLVIKPTNRLPLHTIRDGRFEELGAEYPSAGMWDYRHYHVARDRTVYGVRSYPRQLYRLAPGEAAFAPLPVEGFRKSGFDAGRDRVLILLEGGDLQEWDGQALVPSPLAGLDYGVNDALPMWIAGLEGYLSLSDGELWFRPVGPVGPWQRVRVGLLRKPAFDDVRGRRAHVDRAAGLLVLEGPQEVQVFTLRPGEAPRYRYAVDAVDKTYVPQDGRVMVTVLAEPELGPGRQTRPRVALILTARGAVPAEDYFAEISASDGAPELVSQWSPRNRNGPQVWPAIVHTRDGWRAYDGRGLRPAEQLSPDALGEYARWFRWRGRLFVLSERGLGEVGPGLILTWRDFPETYRSTYEVGIAASEGFGGLFVTHQGRLWFSSDGRRFEKIVDGETGVTRYLSDVPGEAFGLVLGEDGLYRLARGNCRG